MDDDAVDPADLTVEDAPEVLTAPDLEIFPDLVI